jgi:uncharacterized protein (TIGR04255 family)
MMDGEHALPTFLRPPLDEVAADVQFTSLPLRAADIADFHALIKEEYPHSLDVPPLPPSFETAGPVQIQQFLLSNMGSGLLPRTWFISSDDEHVIQLQPDRLIANWRLRPNGGAYPRYPVVRQRFEAALEALNTFVHRHGYPDIIPIQCDLTYFNKVGMTDDTEAGNIGSLLRHVSISATDCQIKFRRLLQSHGEDAVRWLQVECLPVQAGIGRKLWALNISVKGRPASADIAAVFEFLDRAHVEIVNCFVEIATDAMLDAWGMQR